MRQFFKIKYYCTTEYDFEEYCEINRPLKEIIINLNQIVSLSQEDTERINLDMYNYKYIHYRILTLTIGYPIVCELESANLLEKIMLNEGKSCEKE